MGRSEVQLQSTPHAHLYSLLVYTPPPQNRPNRGPFLAPLPNLLNVWRFCLVRINIQASHPPLAPPLSHFRTLILNLHHSYHTTGLSASICTTSTYRTSSLSDSISTTLIALQTSQPPFAPPLSLFKTKAFWNFQKLAPSFAPLCARRGG